MYAISLGNISEGFTLVGPFEFLDDAIEYGQFHFRDSYGSWEVLTMEEPEDGFKFKTTGNGVDQLQAGSLENLT